MNLNNKIIQHLLALAVILVIAAIYFYPEVQGKKILSHDHVSHVAAAKEVNNYKEKGETILWASRIFSGMPAFQIAYSVDSNLLSWMYKTSNVIPKSMWLSLLLMLGFYVCLSILGYPLEIRLIGAIAFSLSTWFLLSIEAGHSTKIVAISFIPPLIASILTVYKGKWLIGGVLTGLFLGLAIVANHVQIIYYSLFFIAILFFVKMFQFMKEKKLPIFFKRTAILIGFAILGVLPNITLLWTTYDYGKETIRGGQSELTATDNQKSSGGLDIEYAMRWSYGPTESLNFLIPGLYAPGASLGESSETYQDLKKKGVPKNQIKNALQGLPMYYGTQTTPTGPSYMGAALIFLFLLMFFIYKENLRWILLGTVILSMVFSWGNNFLMVNEFFFDHFPLFNKFRTPSMWLSLTMIAITWGAMISLKTIYERKFEAIKLKKYLIYIGGALGGLCILIYLMGSSFFDFVGPYDAQLEQSGFSIDFIMEDRLGLLKGDALRTLFIIALMFGTIWAIAYNKIKSMGLGIFIISLVIFGDMWIVGKRFLNSDDFSRAKSYEESIHPSAADTQILNDKDYYRVFNTTVSSFNDNSTSYFHQSVGGYSAAKLILYQDLIERQLSTGNMKVFDMLNTKYFIGGKPGQEVAQQNPGALGSVWYINQIDWAKNADEEMSKLSEFNPKTTAIIDERYKDYLNGFTPNAGGEDNIRLKKFHPDNMEYTSVSKAENLAVFSEIWYKGNVDWKAYIDGKETEFIRVNYLLRGLKVPAGNHEITFKFHPSSHYVGSKISLVSSSLLILLLIGLLVAKLMNKKLPGMEFDTPTES